MAGGGGGGGGGGGVRGHRTPPTLQHSYIYKCRSIQISFRLGGLRGVKMTTSLILGGGGREGVSEEVKTLGEAPPLLYYRLPRTVENYDT